MIETAALLLAQFTLPQPKVLVASIGMILLILVGHVRAETQTRTFHNDKGQVTGRATTRGDTTTFSNERGQVTGRAERRGNTTNFFNERGQMIGSSRGR
jgi:hypothetical protein